MNKLQKTLAVQAATMVLCMLFVGNADAEIRTITATGEYRMGDNDTRTDAKRLALLDAKRLALEHAGSYIESITEIKNFDLPKEEIRAYTAGIVEVVEQATKDIMEGSTHIIRVDVTTKIDTNVVARQIDALRKNAIAKAELLKLRAERDRLKQEVEAKTRDLVTLKFKDEVETATKERQETLNQMSVTEMVEQAWGLMNFYDDAWREFDPNEDINEKFRALEVFQTRAKELIEVALSLDPSYPRAHILKGYLIRRNAIGADDDNKKNRRAAISEFRIALRLDPNDAEAHAWLGGALASRCYWERAGCDEAFAQVRTAASLAPEDAERHRSLGEMFKQIGHLKDAISEYRVAVRLEPDNPIGHDYLGQALEENGDLDEAISEHRTTVRLAEHYWGGHMKLGRALAKKQKWAEALIELRTAHRLAPKPWEVRYHLGFALKENGLKKEAAEVFRGILKDEPHIFKDKPFEHCIQSSMWSYFDLDCMKVRDALRELER